MWVLFLHMRCPPQWFSLKENISIRVSEKNCLIVVTSSSSVRDWEFCSLNHLTYSAEFLPNSLLQKVATNSKYFLFVFLWENPENLYHFHVVLWTLSIHLPLSNNVTKTCEAWWLTTFKFQAHSKILTSCTVRVAMLPTGKTT